MTPVCGTSEGRSRRRQLVSGGISRSVGESGAGRGLRDRSGRRCAGERGSVSSWLVVASFAMVIMVGLVVDLGGQVQAQQRARDVAVQAARAGGQELQGAPAVRGQGARVNPGAAVRAAETYLAASDVDGSVFVASGTSVVVETSAVYRTKFLSIIGLGSLRVTGSAEVRVVRAVGGVEQ